MKPSLAQKIGHGFAHLQDGVDRLVHFGCQKLASTGKKKLPKDAHPAQKALHSATTFLGEMGSAFYTKYEELKETHHMKSSSSKSEIKKK